jgi:hypothetical protein
MGKSNEVLRVGVPVRAVKLAALLGALDASEEATVRHYHGALIVEEPEPTFALDDSHPAGGQS